MVVTGSEIRKFFQKGQKPWVDALIELAPVEAPKAGIATIRQWKHFLSQTAAETDGLRLKNMRESLAYSADRFLEVFSYRLGLAQKTKRFKGMSKAEIASIVVHDRELMMEIVYNNRKELGNIQPGDGYRFIGRGPLQMTGRKWYAKVGREIGVDLVANPELIETDPHIAWRACFVEWRLLGVNKIAEKGSVEAVSRKVNGGTNGLARREKEFATATLIWPGEGSFSVAATVPALASEPDTPEITPRHADAPPAAITAAQIAADGSRSMSWLLQIRNWIAGSSVAIGSWFGFDTFGAARGTISELKILLADHALVVVLGILGVALAAILVVQHYVVVAAREGRYVPGAKAGT